MLTMFTVTLNGGSNTQHQLVTVIYVTLTTYKNVNDVKKMQSEKWL